MTTGTIALIDYLRKIELELDDDWLRQMVQNFTQAVIELEAEQQIGASRHERTAGRTTQRNGYRGCCAGCVAAPPNRRFDLSARSRWHGLAPWTYPPHRSRCRESAEYRHRNLGLAVDLRPRQTCGRSKRLEQCRGWRRSRLVGCNNR